MATYEVRSSTPISNGTLAEALALLSGIQKPRYSTVTQHPPQTYRTEVYEGFAQSPSLVVINTINPGRIITTGNRVMVHNPFIDTTFMIETSDSKVTPQVVQNVLRALG